MSGAESNIYSLKKFSIILSCEHAGNEVPEEYRYLFAEKEEVLNTHRAYDPGAWEIAQFMATKLNVPLFACRTTRLLVEANRSLDSAELFSEFSNQLNLAEKQQISDKYYFPYRNRVEQAITHTPGPVLHISVHTFTPVWEGQEREVDIGLLFDPESKKDTDICTSWKIILEELLPECSVRFNEPYSGTSDGFTTYMRHQYPRPDYVGIEIEVNQKFYFQDKWSFIAQQLTKTISEYLSLRLT
jgi:predicted N-formylglutamate amidohydrolase